MGRNPRHRGSRSRLSSGTAPVVWLLVLGVLALMVAGGGAAHGHGHGSGRHYALAMVNVALGAEAHASASDADAVRAIDGDASSMWCPTSNEAELVVDLPRGQRVESIAITWQRNSPPSGTLASLDAATVRHWRRIWAGSPGEPNDDPYGLSVVELHGRYLSGVRLRMTAADGSVPCVGELRLFVAEHASGSIRGADVSFAPQVEATGATFSDERGVRPLENILVDHGANWARLRLWVNPPAGYSDLDSVLGMARRIHAAGMKLLLDFHYSDFWADPSKQFPPTAWERQGLATMAQTVERYTRDVVATLAAQETPVDMVQIGNEVVGGMLWPNGKIYQDDGEHWSDFATLVKAGIDGAHEGAPSWHPLRTMIHIDRGGNNGDSRYFFDRLIAEGVDFDAIGESFYTFWHGSLSDMRANIDDLAMRYDKDIVIVETAYPWTLENGDELGNFIWSPDQLPVGYPATPEGQEMFMLDLYSDVRFAPNGRGLGFFYWEPEWLPVVGWQPGDGNPNDNLTLFDFQGHGLASLALFGGSGR